MSILAIHIHQEMHCFDAGEHLLRLAHLSIILLFGQQTEPHIRSQGLEISTLIGEKYKKNYPPLPL